MGCDIHMYAEVRIKSKVDDRYWWNKLGSIFKNRYFAKDRIPDEYNREYTDEPYRGGNYELFAALAGVRNYNSINPFRIPGGLPEDISEDIKRLSDNWGIDGHSHSYILLSEFDDLYWEKHKDVLRGDFSKYTLPALRRFCKKWNIEHCNLRLVFWFDN